MSEDSARSDLSKAEQALRESMVDHLVNDHRISARLMSLARKHFPGKTEQDIKTVIMNLWDKKLLIPDVDMRTRKYYWMIRLSPDGEWRRF